MTKKWVLRKRGAHFNPQDNKNGDSVRSVKRVVSFLFAVMVAASTAAAGTDALPSWNDGAAKSAIIAFVQTATDTSGMKFVPPPQRIVVFDNDGTLWSSHPMYVQLAFALDRVKALAPLHPAWKTKQPFKAVLEGDLKTVLAGGCARAWHSPKSAAGRSSA